MAEDAKPAKWTKRDTKWTSWKKDTWKKLFDIELAFIFIFVIEKNLQVTSVYLLVLEKMKNAEPAGIGSFLAAMLYSDILRGLADVSCPSSKREFDFLFT